MRKKKKTGRIMMIVMASAMSLSMLGGGVTSSLQVKAAETVSNPWIANDGTVTWDKITFGNYNQDAEFMAEPIKWRILDIDSEGNAFLLADEALDCKQYNEEMKKTDSGEYIYMDDACTWETCTLRDWLNGTDDYTSDDTAFIKAAFTDEERNTIIETTVVNEDNPFYETEGGNNTTDKIYLLSIEEATNISYGFDETLSEMSNTRQAKATDYARVKGAYRSNSSGEAGNCQWWLRSPGEDSNCAVYTNIYGKGYDFGCSILDDSYAVRPALHVNLSSLCVKDAGSVTSSGIITTGTNNTKDVSDYDKPSVDSEGVTTWDCVYFGNYKQSASFDKKPIEWRVLSVNGNDAFVVADQAIDCKLYNEQGVEKTYSDGEIYTDYSCTWETCTLRDWLNGTDTYEGDNTAFINTAFTDEERNAIIETNVVNDDNPSYNTEGGNNTTDKIYLLSIEEASNTSYGFSRSFDEENKVRQTKVTDYAYINGGYRCNVSGYVGNCRWWLRSPGLNSAIAVIVSGQGRGYYDGYSVYGSDYAVRPALHVNLSSSHVKVAGTVSSENNMTDDETEMQEKVNGVIALISAIGTVTKDSKTAIDVARSAYDTLSESAKAKVTNYSVLQAAEAKLKEIEKNANNTDKKIDTPDNKKEEATIGQNQQQEQTSITEQQDTNTSIVELSTDNVTTFNIKNKKTYKKSQKVTIKDPDGIKSIKLNGKTIKIKAGKKSISFKLSKYKKYFKKKGKWNKLVVTDVNGNKKTIQFKVK